MAQKKIIINDTARDTAKKLFFVMVAGLTSAFSMNFFLIPANVYGAGINGIAQLLYQILKDAHIANINAGIFILLFNIPIAILGWFKIGKSFTLYSFLTSMVISLFAFLIPIHSLSTNPLMNGVFGGVITGVGVGYALKYGFSTGGMDIVSMVLTKTTGKSIGAVMFGINLLIIFAAGLYFGWESALYTIISIYCMTRVIDGIHTSHQKVTAMIVTQRPKEVIAAIHGKLIRGITVIPSKGAYRYTDNTVLMVVITRYEMYDLEQAAKTMDPSCFINILNTLEVVGEFWDIDKQQKSKKLLEEQRNEILNQDNVNIVEDKIDE